jgi:hypothetical protein
MKKLFLLTFCLFTTLNTVFAQQFRYEEVIYLKNGSVIRGMIIEEIPNESYKIQTADRNIFVYKISEITKITKEPISKKTEIIEEEKPLYPAKGYMNITEMQIGSTIDAREGVSFGLNTIHGYQFSPKFGLGLGVGYQNYNGYYRNVPVFVDFRYTFKDAKVSPYLGVQSGIGVLQNYSKNDTDVYTSLAFGAKFRSSTAFNFHLGLASTAMITSRFTYVGILLRLGFSF